ncbi:MAG: TonB-dependent receptor [Gracilimonas sp.]
MMRIAKTLLLLVIVLIGTTAVISAQNGTLSGVVTDKDDGSPLIGVNVIIRGTSFGSATNLDGEYTINNIRPGDYSVEFRYIGYERLLLTGINIKAGETTEINIEMGEQAITSDEEVTVIGEKPIFDVEQSSTSTRVSREQIEAAPVRKIEDVVGNTAGVFKDPTGLYIRGGRANETGYVVDGVSAQDPLAGTGFGLDLGTNAYSNVEVTTGGVDVEHGNLTSGVVTVQTRDGGNSYSGSFTHKRDNPGRMTSSQANFFSDIYELTLGGPLPITENLLPALGLDLPGSMHFFMTSQVSISNEFTKNNADQVQSSLFENTFWTPRQDNRWNGMFKLTYKIKPGMRVETAYQRSTSINQNTRMLQIIGDNAQIRPGYQFFFEQNLDNANTYTHDSKLAYVKWTHALSGKSFYDVQLSRLFTRLRADANGRDWRPETVDGEFDSRSIVVYPVNIYPATNNFTYVLPGPGLANNGGIADLWHDHYAEEYTLRSNFTTLLAGETNRLRLGLEMKFMEYQWIDITKPWVGAPIQIGENEFTETSQLGRSSDIWNVRPSRGAIYLSDQIRYQGLIANLGLRYEYWFPGAYVDEFVDDPLSPVPDQVKQAYKESTYSLFGNRFKMRLLPRINVSFPVRENMVMYFNYTHKTKLPHPTYVYAGLDPFYQDRSFLSDLGNPNLNPEVDISYELGFRYQLTSNDALNINAFWSDKYDFITAERIVLPDETSRTFRVNGDFARVRGIEISYIKRYSHFIQANISGTYSRAEGLSSTSNDALTEIIEGGQDIGNNIETPLAWDRPFDVKGSVIFTWDREEGMFGINAFNDLRAYLSGTFRSGLRYTPMIFDGNQINPVTNEPNWRPDYIRDPDPNARYSKIGESWLMFDFNFEKWFEVKGTRIVASFEITNLLNNKNPAIINPVTGKGYRTDYPEDPTTLRGNPEYDVPSNVRDPRYEGPYDNNVPAYLNPANFLEQRHIMFGLAINF